MPTGIALALSGGGYRAALFHAGALVRLAELGVLSQITRVSAISGGAIIAGVWLDELRIHPNDSQNDRAKKIQTRVMQMCSQTIDVGTVLGGIFNPFQSVNDTLIKAYRKHLCPNDAPLSAFPQAPHFTFCSTNLQTGRQVYLDNAGISDYRVGVHPHRVTLCEAVAASSAFPPLLAPMDVDLDASKWTLSNHAIEIQRKPPSRLRLCDGGAYDNMGLEPVWNDGYEHLLVSDGGAPYSEPERIKSDWMSILNNVFEIATDQSRGLRKRWLIERFEHSSHPNPIKGTYWGIAGDVADYKFPAAMTVNPLKSGEMCKVSTRLAPFDDGVHEQLINWGYAICDTAIRRWCPNLASTTVVPSWPIASHDLA